MRALFKGNCSGDDIMYEHLTLCMNIWRLYEHLQQQQRVIFRMRFLFLSSGLCHDGSSRKPPARRLRRVHPGGFPHPAEHRGPHSRPSDDPWGCWVADPQPLQCGKNGLHSTGDGFPVCVRAWWQIPDSSVSFFTRNSKPELDWWCCELKAWARYRGPVLFQFFRGY